MRYSIIIPTYNKFHEALSKCVPPLLRYTNCVDIEIIIVCNGSNQETRNFIKLYENRFSFIRHLWFDEGLGYAKAVNEGIKISKGEYIILLNDDTILLTQQRNEWIKILEQPFLEDEKMGLTAPMKTFSESANHWFLIFFCVMIHRKVIDKIGLLDEAFFSYGEDTSMCIEAEKAGFKIKQVPVDTEEYYAPNRMTGNFPIFHEGNVSHKNWVGGEELIAKNNAILKERYNNKSMVNIKKAEQCDGFMSSEELTFIATLAKENRVVAEIGVWHGRSSRAIADNLPDNAVLYCIDTWQGSKSEQETNHASAKGMDGDAAYFEFLENLADLIESGKVIPLRMSSKNAAAYFQKRKMKFDFCFVDAGHEEHEVREDIQNWLPLVKDGGTLCGHDYYYHDNIWVGVKKAVDELLPNITIPHNTSIWVYKKEARKPVVIDAFPFNNELEILDIRFETLFDVVDRFILVEAMTTHGGKPKELVFQNNLDRYQKYLHKVTYLVIPEFPVFEGTVTDKSWARERYQRDYIMQSLKDCKDDDIIIVSDVDEIPNTQAVAAFKQILSGDNAGCDFMASLEMDLYYYNEHTKEKEKWNEAKILTYGKLKQLSPCGARYEKYLPVLGNAGRHLSYFGGVDKIIQKIEDTAHQELNTPYFKDPNHIKKAIENGTDLFNRDYVKFEMI
jgi:beta-1,4-mannosyl-glycoprotein beta-1,4-N-acetylglucosaminyltransferase